MLVDANLLLYAVDETSPHHDASASWLTGVLNGQRRVAIPWQTVGAFVRIATHPRIAAQPLDGPAAWGHVQAWLARPVVWIPSASQDTASVLGELIAAHNLSGNAIPDAQLAALAIEHGLTVMSADTDFARFPEVSWSNPLA